MFTGLPGTGIGGLFYLLTVVPTMVVIEIGRTVIGRGNFARARFVFGQALLSVSIVGVYILTGTALHAVLPTRETAVLGIAPKTVTAMVVAFPFALLFTVLAATQLLGLVLKIQEKLHAHFHSK